MDQELAVTPVKRGRGRPKGSKNKPKFKHEPVVGKARADFQCEHCKEMYVLPVSAMACPDSECGGSVTRIWAGAPPGIKSAATSLVDKVVGNEVDVAKKQLNYKPEFTSKAHQGSAALGMVGADGRSAARSNWPIFQSLSGPTPNWAR